MLVMRVVRRQIWYGAVFLIILAVTLITNNYLNLRQTISPHGLSDVKPPETRKYYQQKPALQRPAEWSLEGIGELGVPVTLKDLTPEERLKQVHLKDKYGINIFLSDRISPHRMLRDSRNPLCHQKPSFDYTSLPATTVIIVFYNEPWSTLVRTVYSVLHNTPDVLLDQIILLDDCSDKDQEHLHDQLEVLISTLPKVKLLRNRQGEGLIRSKLIALAHATSEVVAFMDAHCEVMHGWLEPLLVSIRNDSTTVAVPVTDDIDSTTFEYYYGTYVPSIGGFTWQMYFHWRFMSEEKQGNLKTFVEPIPTPTISGGLFAVNREFFLRIGAWDSGMDIWGGENVELSFRVWMCGGKLMVLPCSHIGHVSRNINTYNKEQRFWYNVKRATSVLMDDKYRRHVHLRMPEYQVMSGHGDIEDRVNLINNLKCKSFQWYLENVFPEKYVPSDREGWYGAIRNNKTGECVDSGPNSDQAILYPCLSASVGPQFFERSINDELRHNYAGAEDCLTLVQDSDGSKAGIKPCAGYSQPIPDNQKWIFRPNGQIESFECFLCLAAAEDDDAAGGYKLTFLACDDQKEEFKWHFHPYFRH